MASCGVVPRGCASAGDHHTACSHRNGQSNTAELLYHQRNCGKSQKIWTFNNNKCATISIRCLNDFLKTTTTNNAIRALLRATSNITVSDWTIRNTIHEANLPRLTQVRCAAGLVCSASNTPSTSGLRGKCCAPGWQRPSPRSSCCSWLLHQHHVKRMGWPALSPDVRPTEDFWGILGRPARRNFPAAGKLNQLFQNLQQ